MIEDIKFLNRETGSVETEQVYGENWLKIIYGSPLGRIPLWVAIKRAWFSKWYGRKMDLPESRGKITPFISKYKLDKKEFLKDPSEHNSFNDFFSRKLITQARPINSSADTVVFPADGRHLGIQNLSKNTRIFTKGQKFNLPALFRSTELAKPFTDGSAVISRLCPVDYHRFHFPISGNPTIPELINGSLFSVNPIALRKKISIFWENKRYLSFIEETPVGRVAIFLIGATCVGSVKFSVKFQDPIQKGDELGYFLFGGSCVITLFEEGAVTLAEDLLESTGNGLELYAKMGDHMCKKD
jgi:phosphatidylserine decarboxylase